jgi:transcriptional regulator with GAF, ATPase, and Fis domain
MPDKLPMDSSAIEKLSHLTAINGIIDKICGIRETNHIMDALISELVNMTDSDQGIISLVTSARIDSLSTVVRFREKSTDDLPSQIGNQFLGWILKNKTSLKIDDLDADERFDGLDSHGGRFRRVLCFPMIVRGEITGVAILVRSAIKKPFEDTHCRMMGILVPQSAQILANARLLEELTRTNELLELSRRKLKQENLQLKSEISSSFAFENIIGRSSLMKRALALVSKYCVIDSPVLITGETGTGKDLIAQGIHYNSDRKDKSFVVINCGLKTETLLESELFGHLKGSFTGAIRNKIGLFKEADGGTIFLDEIGDAPLSTQVAILRVIQNGEIRPIGATKSERVDVRVISATNKNLSEQISARAFREDLFYRLNTFAIELPALRERREDIPLLVSHLLNKISIKVGRDRLSIMPEALDILVKYRWPGNVRELASEIERAAVTCRADGVIAARDLSPHLVLAMDAVAPAIDLSGKLKQQVEALEKEMIKRTLAENRGNVQQTSLRLGLTRKGLINKIKRYQIVLDYKKIVSD